MIKYYCDKCDKELENTDIFTIEIVPPEIRRWDDDAMTGTGILCRECTKRLVEWTTERSNDEHSNIDI